MYQLLQTHLLYILCQVSTIWPATANKETVNFWMGSGLQCEWNVWVMAVTLSRNLFSKGCLQALGNGWWGRNVGLCCLFQGWQDMPVIQKWQRDKKEMRYVTKCSVELFQCIPTTLGRVQMDSLESQKQLGCLDWWTISYSLPRTLEKPFNFFQQSVLSQKHQDEIQVGTWPLTVSEKNPQNVGRLCLWHRENCVKLIKITMTPWIFFPISFICLHDQTCFNSRNSLNIKSSIQYCN